MNKILLLFLALLMFFNLLFSLVKADDDNIANILNLILEEENIDEEHIYSTSNFQYGDLQILEIFPKDTDILTEYIVLKANTHFYGKIDIVGLGRGKASKTVSLNLLSGELIVIVDNENGFADKQNLLMMDSISITDGGQNLSIIHNGTILDNITFEGKSKAYSYFSNDIYSDLRHFEEIGDPNVSIFSSFDFDSILFVNDNNYLSLTGINNLNFDYPMDCSIYYNNNNYNCSEQFLINSFFPFDQISFVIRYFNKHLKEDKLIVLSQTTNDEPICSGSQINNIFDNGSLKITEIYPFDTERYSEYLEIQSEGFYSGNIIIEGLGRGSANKPVHINLYSGDYLLISDILSGFDFADNQSYVSSVSLTDRGQEISLIGQDGQVLDKVKYTSPLRGKSSYFSSFSGDLRFMDYISEPSPGYDNNLYDFILDGIGGGNTVSCNIKLQNSTAFYKKNSINLIAVYNNKEIQNSNLDYSCQWKIGSGEVFTGCNPYYFKLENEGIINISLEILNNDSIICTSKTYLNLPIYPECGSCNQEYYQGLYTKRKAKYNTLASSIRNYGFVVISDKAENRSKEKLTVNDNQYSYLTGFIKISQLLPNPEGSDKGNEMIKFEILSGNSFDLSGFVLSYGKRNFKLDLGLFYDFFVLTGDFAFPNSPSCIILKKNLNVYDTFCYPKPQDGQVFTGSVSALKDEKLDFVNKLKINLQKDKVCINYNKSDIICKDLIYSYTLVNQLKDDIKKLKKEYTKIFKLNERNILKIDKLDLKLDKEKQLYKSGLVKNKIKLDKKYQNLEKKYKERNDYIKKLKSDYKSRKLKQEQLIKKLRKQYSDFKTKINAEKKKLDMSLKLSNNYIKFINNKLETNRYQIYNNSGIKQDYKLYQTCSRNIKQDKYYINYFGLEYNVYDYKSISSISKGKVGILEILTKNIDNKKKQYKIKIEQILKLSNLNSIGSLNNN